MFGKLKNNKHRRSHGMAATDSDSTPPPLEDFKTHDLDANVEDASMSDFGEDDDDNVEDLQATAAKETRNSLARQETQAVSCLRYVVLFVLLGTAVGVSVATFYYSRSVETESFETEFESVATMTLRSFVESVEHKVGALDVLATGVTSHALESGETFPNVTVPDFEVKGAQLRTQTDAIYSFYLPLVTDETRAGYEAYTAMMQAQIFGQYMAEEGLKQYQDQYFGIEKEETEATDAEAEEAVADEEAALETEEHSHGDGEEHSHNEAGRQLHAAPPEVHPVIHEGIWGLTLYNESWIEPPGTGPYLPFWQQSPVIPMPSLVNYNFLAYYDIAPMMRQSLRTGKMALSYIQTNHTGSNTADLIRVYMTLNQYRHENIDYQEDPLTQVTYPVFDSFNPVTKQVSGLVVTTIFWRLLFTNILPESVKGVVCVLSNTLGESITYQIDGHEVTFLGNGDLHDEKYDDMGVSRDIAEYMNERAGPTTQSYTTVALDGGYTSYRIHVYPSETMEDSYVTTDPIIYAVIVAFIFVFTSMVFMLYDRLVERRQAKVMDTAVKSTAVVTSLFPKAVHERLFADATSGEMSNAKLDAWKASSAEMSMSQQPSIADLMRSSRNSGSRDLAALAMPKIKGKGRPIADKFPNTTVLFADLAGFTQWSATREPESVFILLETLYGAFDKVAVKRQVFKVETIGDCYMAVTGLPAPQADNAVRMVKFARDCMQRMQRLVDELSMSLGEDTKELAMRVGLHSGPVTAGVLRGDKGRFQLFGDTVNTASRMESNGVKGRIHVSESTAMQLPEKWVTMREDKIVAKGKGEMTTYFVETGGARSSITSAILSTESIEFSGSRHDPSVSVHTNRLEDITERNMDGSNMDASAFTQGSSRRISNLTSASNRHDYRRAISFEDEMPEQSQVNSRVSFVPNDAERGSLALFGKSLAVALGVSEEVEV